MTWIQHVFMKSQPLLLPRDSNHDVQEHSCNCNRWDLLQWYERVIPIDATRDRHEERQHRFWDAHPEPAVREVSALWGCVQVACFRNSLVPAVIWPKRRLTTYGETCALQMTVLYLSTLSIWSICTFLANTWHLLGMEPCFLRRRLCGKGCYIPSQLRTKHVGSKLDTYNVSFLMFHLSLNH